MALSVGLNVLMLALTLGIDPRKPPTVLSRLVDGVLLPGSLIAKLILGAGHSGVQVFGILLASTVFYAVSFWSIFLVLNKYRQQAD